MDVDPRFDVARVAASACASDPSLSPDLAQVLAERSWEHLVAMDALDAPELSRRLLAGSDGVGASETNAVATAAVDECESAGLQP